MHIVLEPQHKKGKKTVLCHNRVSNFCMVIERGDDAELNLATSMAGALHANGLTMLANPNEVAELEKLGWEKIDAVVMVREVPRAS